MHILDNSKAGYFFAKIENTGDEPIATAAGSLVLFTQEDDILLSKNHLTATPYRLILAPGEYAYVFDTLWDEALEKETVGDMKFAMKSDTRGYISQRIPCEVSFDISESEDYNFFVHVTFVNDADKPRENYKISVALMDAEHNLLFVSNEDTHDILLYPGGKVTVKLRIDRDLILHLRAKGLEVVEADAIVFYVEEQ